MALRNASGTVKAGWRHEHRPSHRVRLAHPDYRAWAFKLITSLDDRGIPHDIVEVPKLPGSWEANTMAKPAHLLDAMDRHPDKVIVFLDVDCRVRGDLSPLAEIGGDVGFYLRTKWRRSGGMRFGARSGTVVVRPTAGARAYVEAWIAAAAEAPWGNVDQAAADGRHGARAVVRLHDAAG